MTTLRNLLQASLAAGALLVAGTALAADGAAAHQHHGASPADGQPCAMMRHDRADATPCGCHRAAPGNAWEKSSDAIDPSDVGYQAG